MRNAEDRLDGQAELHVETIQIAIWGIFGLGFAILAFAAIGLNRMDGPIFGIVIGLWASAYVAHVTFCRWPIVAGRVVVTGLIAMASGALLVLPGPVVAPWFAFAVLLAGALLGWRSGAATALATMAILALATWRLPLLMPGDTTFSAMLLDGASLFAAWLLTRPTRIALHWAWSSYLRALDQTNKARERQAELARLSKSLAESYYQLEQLNLELERARRSAQEARRLKAEFAASVSHELRTPLNLIIGFCEMMVLAPSAAYGQELPAQYRSDLEAIYRNACHISALVDDILDLSQIDADRMALHREWMSVTRVIDEAVATVERFFLDRDLTIRILIPADLPRAFVDPTRIRQILINLLGNAARLLEEGGVTIRAEREMDTILISVADTGPGIPVEELPHIFDEFRQVSTAGRRRGGSGLGLTVSKRFAELHGGALWVESKVGEGSTFYLRLPLDGATEQPPQAGLSWDERVGRRVRGQARRRIVVVDDVGDTCKVFQRYLDGYQIVRAPTIESSQRLLRDRPIQAIVLGSPSALVAWKEQPHLPPDLQRLPVIACPLHTAQQTAPELGVQSYLVKPVTRTQLRAAVRHLGRTVRSALVVDDDVEMAHLLSRMLRSIVRDCRIETASDGRAVLEILRAQHPDLLVLDLLMPDMSGYTVLDAMRHDASLCGTSVLVVTARGLQDETVVATAFSVTRDGGMTVGEVMRWLKSGLDALLGPVEETQVAPRVLAV